MLDFSQTLPIATRIILSALPHFRFYRKPQFSKGLGKIRSCFSVCFFKYIDISTTVRTTLHLYIPFQIWTAVYASCFSSSWWSNNSADNSNREIEAYTDLGLAFQKNTALQLGPDFKGSLILFSNKINSQIYKRFHHFGNLIIRSSCWAHLQSQLSDLLTITWEVCGRAGNRALFLWPGGHWVQFLSNNAIFMSCARILYLMSFSLGNLTDVCEEIIFKITLRFILRVDNAAVR